MNSNTEIVEGNKLICKFMGLVAYNEGGHPYEYGYYHQQWNYLMPVVEKIEQDEKFATLIYVNAWDNRGKYCFSIFRELDENGGLRHKFVEYACHEKIKAVWAGVVEFIRIKNEGMIPRTAEDFNKNYSELQRKITTLQYPDEKL